MTRRGRPAPRRPRRRARTRRSGLAGLGLLTRLALVLVVVLPNLVGAGVVLVLAAWVLPTECSSPTPAR